MEKEKYAQLEEEGKSKWMKSTSMDSCGSVGCRNFQQVSCHPFSKIKYWIREKQKQQLNENRRNARK